MKKILLTTITIYLIITAELSAQENRLSALGGLSIGIEDISNQLSPFDFGGNPAWLFMDEKESYLDISPAVSNSWGSYHRQFDSEGDMYYGTAFKGVKTLGDLGTFQGFTSYNYEVRRNYYRTLKYDSYSGEAFFFTDTTEGNFHYNGPKVNLMYSWELFDNLYAGGSVSYQLMDGLKKVYTYAKTIYRDVGGNFGLAYNPIEELVLGINYSFFDSQESIEAADVNLLEVETFNFRGETYFVPDRGSSVNQKIRKKGSTFSGQVYWKESEHVQLALQINYSPSNSKVLIPEGSFKEVEEGYAYFESFNFQFKSLFNISEYFTAGAYASSNINSSWSKHSHKILLLWEWKINDINFGVGGSYKIFSDLLIGAEYILTNKAIDSLKYIDNRTADLNSLDHTIKFGIEYNVIKDFVVRTGINLNHFEYDLKYGGSNVDNLSFTVGFGIPVSESILLDSYVKYSRINPIGSSSMFRSNLGAFVNLRLNSF